MLLTRRDHLKNELIKLLQEIPVQLPGIYGINSVCMLILDPRPNLTSIRQRRTRNLNPLPLGARLINANYHIDLYFRRKIYMENSIPLIWFVLPLVGVLGRLQVGY